MPENTLIISFVKRMYEKTKQKSRFQKKIPMAFSARIKFTSYKILHSVGFLNIQHQTVCGDILPLVEMILQMFYLWFFFWLWLSIVSLPITTLPCVGVPKVYLRHCQQMYESEVIYRNNGNILPILYVFLYGQHFKNILFENLYHWFYLVNF